MAKMKQSKHDSVKEKATLAKRNEKVINDFLLQFAYTLTIGVISIFMYNASNFMYGDAAYRASNKFMWGLFALTLVLCIAFLVLYILKKQNKHKTLAIYSFATAAVAFWYVGVQEIVYGLKVPFVSKFFTGAPKIILCIFPLLGIALAVEFIVYFIRYYKINRKK